MIRPIDWEILYEAEMDFRFLRAKAKAGLSEPTPTDEFDLEQARASLVRTRAAFLRKARA